MRIAQSTVTYFTGTDVIDRVKRLVLRAIPADAPPIFHAAEHPTLVLVSDQLKQRLDSSSSHPGVLTPVEEWTNCH